MDNLLGRRKFLAGLFAVAAVVVTAPVAGAYGSADSFLQRRRRRRRVVAAAKNRNKRAIRPRYTGATMVDFASYEKPGTLIIKTSERALYQIRGNGKAMRYMVAVGKEGFSWSGVAKVGMKRVNPVWTPPPEMIERTPKYAKWADGMPGGLPINPLGPRAMYLFNKGGDTGFRIHGTIHPGSIGTAASSGCIRMLNHEVIRLYEQTPRGTKVIVI